MGGGGFNAPHGKRTNLIACGGFTSNLVRKTGVEIDLFITHEKKVDEVPFRPYLWILAPIPHTVGALISQPDLLRVPGVNYFTMS